MFLKCKLNVYIFMQVPFGDVKKVTEFLGVRGKVAKPDMQHPKRPILGFDMSRSEVSLTWYLLD